MLLKFLACGTVLNPNYAEAGNESQAAFTVVEPVINTYL